MERCFPNFSVSFFIFNNLSPLIFKTGGTLSNFINLRCLFLCCLDLGVAISFG